MKANLNHRSDSEYEPGSFRDRHGRVFIQNGEIYRTMSAEALQEWEALATTRFFPALMKQGKIISTESSDAAPPEGTWAGTLKHERIPFLSYPYEWTFGMLKDVALLQLDLLSAALEEGFILKDSSAYNFQWNGSQPVLIDVLSLKRLSPGEVWVGYRQFCQMFLYPLMLQAYKSIPFQSWLRGNVDGILPEMMNRLMSMKDRFRAGVFSHVYLQSKLQQSYENRATSVKSELQKAGFSREMILINVNRLAKLIRSMEWDPGKSEWANYTQCTSYSNEDAQQKSDFVRGAIDSRKWNLVWDLGCNTGVFSKMAAENAKYVVALDADTLAVERLYVELKAQKNRNIMPLVMGIADPSPSLGWRGRERKSLEERGTPDLILCLALIHHMTIGSNIPVKEFVDWLADFGSALIIEFVSREDPMVKRLLMNKEDIYRDYDQAYFEACLAKRFRILRRATVSSGTRTLYFAEL